MSVRTDWKFNGISFRETFGVNGRRMFFIDGKITPRSAWALAMRNAKAVEAARNAQPEKG